MSDEKALNSSHSEDSSSCLSAKFEDESRQCFELIGAWSDREQVEFIKQCLGKSSLDQLSHIYAHLLSLLRRDFVSLCSERSLLHIAEEILLHLDAQSLCNAELVCKQWQAAIVENGLWRKLIEREVRNILLWKSLFKKRGWMKYIRCDVEERKTHHFYKIFYRQVLKEIVLINENWAMGRYKLKKIQCQNNAQRGVYCLQYDDEKIVSGLRDNTIKIWDPIQLECVKTLAGHTGSVLCLQYNDEFIISGSSDATVRIWDIATGELLNTLVHHTEAVLHLHLNKSVLVICSKDRSITVWNINSPTSISLRRALVGHRAAVNVVEFDSTYIVSGSGDRTIKVWSTSTCDFLRTLSGHRRGIACLQYREKLIVSGGSDNTIRLWDVETGDCLRILEGHEDLVRCLRFDGERIISGAYDGKIKVWNLKMALDGSSSADGLCVTTLMEHTARVFRVQFDEFQIVSSSHDDTILIWDFSDCSSLYNR